MPKKRIHQYLKSVVTRWMLDEHEKAFIRHALNAGNLARNKGGMVGGSNVLVQMSGSYYYLYIFFFALNYMGDSIGRISGLWHQNIMSSPKGEIFPNIFLGIRKLFNALDRHKWQKLYRSIGVDHVFALQSKFSAAPSFRGEALSIWKNLTSKRSLLDLTLNETYCGDLIYDTYLRYRIQPTVDLSDPFLGDLIEKALVAQFNIKKILKEENVKILLSSYSSYIQHGIPVREALKAGVEVFTAGNVLQHFKRLCGDDYLHAACHWHYGQLFSSLPKHSQADAMNMSRVALEGRFHGSIDKATSYMKQSAYSANLVELPEGVDGVLFLHDFFDSPHCYRNMLFEDFWEWVNFTLRTISDENLSIAVKPHPNQLPESAAVVEELKILYPKIRWIDPKASNAQIFTSGIKIGISVYGTILHELAYHGIVALAAGDHPHIDFNIACTPKSIDEYKNILLNYQDLSVQDDVKNEVLSFYFMHNIYNKEELLVSFQDCNFREIDSGNSSSLSQFVELTNVEGK